METSGEFNQRGSDFTCLVILYSKALPQPPGISWVLRELLLILSMDPSQCPQAGVPSLSSRESLMHLFWGQVMTPAAAVSCLLSALPRVPEAAALTRLGHTGLRGLLVCTCLSPSIGCSQSWGSPIGIIILVVIIIASIY